MSTGNYKEKTYTEKEYYLLSSISHMTFNLEAKLL